MKCREQFRGKKEKDSSIVIVSPTALEIFLPRLFQRVQRVRRALLLAGIAIELRVGWLSMGRNCSNKTRSGAAQWASTVQNNPAGTPNVIIHFHPVWTCALHARSRKRDITDDAVGSRSEITRVQQPLTKLRYIYIYIYVVLSVDKILSIEKPKFREFRSFEFIVSNIVVIR